VSVGYCLITGYSYYFMQHCIPEDWNPHLCCCENMKTHISGLFLAFSVCNCILQKPFCY